jgi:hypothetical protein
MPVQVYGQARFSKRLSSEAARSVISNFPAAFKSASASGWADGSEWTRESKARSAIWDFMVEVDEEINSSV